MTRKTLTAAIAIISFISCNSISRQNNAGKDVPAVLTQTPASYDIIKKRGYEDLIESLYSELAAKDLQLKNIEDFLEALNRSKGDSTHAFLEFDQKNKSYYNAANTHVSQLKDSVLKRRLTALIANNMAAYHSKVSKHTSLLSAIDSNTATINDLHLVLKIVTTLPVIRKYQDSSLPATSSLTGFTARQSQAIKLVDTLIKK